MAQIVSKRIKKFIKDYVETLEPHIRVEKVILFGSYARGKVHRDSDIDLIIISPDFKKREFMERLIWLSKMRGEKFINRAMDIFGYTPKEFENIAKESIIMREAKKEGKIIYKTK